MNSHPSRPVEKIVFRLTAVVLLSLAAACAALAQAPSGVGPPPVINPKGDSDTQTNREANLRSAEMGSAVTQLSQQRLAAVIEQTRQDFKRIQLVRNEMVDNLVAKKPLDYKLISEQAAEVNKRAGRLKSFLMRPAPEGDKKDEKEDGPKRAEYDADALKGALVRLCNAVYSFTSNPMFKDPSVVDAQKAAKAGGDLLDIIRLSDDIKRSADRLGKSSN